MRRFLSAMLYGLVLGVPFALAQSSDRSYLRSAQPVKIAAAPVSFFGTGSQKAASGKLSFICGISLSSELPEFGGLSGLAVSRDGKRFTAVSDEGSWLNGNLTYRGECLTGVTDTVMGPLLGESGRPLAQKRVSDSEGIAVAVTGETTGTVYVSFERLHRVAQYTLKNGAITGKAKTIRLPADVRRLGNNEGPEGITVLQGGELKGSLLVIGEAGPKGTAENTPSPAWLITGGKKDPLQVALSDGYKITGAAALENGDVLILERRFKGILSGVQMRVRRVSADSIKPGATLNGPVLIEASSYGYDVDNMEGIAVHPGKDGDIIVTIVSDNNFNELQRTLLLQFRYRT